jgi:hypothetical protein
MRRDGQGKYYREYHRRSVNEDGQDGAGETVQRWQWKQGTSLRKTVIEGKSGDWGQRNGNSCKVIGKYMYMIHLE